jgi:hypothetical protein
MMRIKLVRIVEKLVIANTTALRPKTSLLTSFAEFVAMLVTLRAIVLIVHVVLTTAICLLVVAPCRMTLTDSWTILTERDRQLILVDRLVGMKEGADRTTVQLELLLRGPLEVLLAGQHHGQSHRTLGDHPPLHGQIVARQVTTTTLAQEAVVQLLGLVAVEVVAAAAEVALRPGSPITTTRITEVTKAMEAMVRMVMEVMATDNKAMVTKAPATVTKAVVARTMVIKTTAIKATVVRDAITHLRHRRRLIFRLHHLQATFRRLLRLLERTDCKIPGLLAQIGSL